MLALDGPALFGHLRAWGPPGVALLLALSAPELGAAWFQRWEDRLGRIARHRGWCIGLLAALALGARILALPLLPVPTPAVADEFSYLLAADTFAHGRLANATHPLWPHFDTLYELQRPTYASVYPPGQGIMLGLGQVLTGNPYWGVWLSSALMCAAILWALQAWMSAAWALTGAWLALVIVGPLSSWGNSYWGGAVAAIGGALVLGAWPRLRGHAGRRVAIAYSLVLALGCGILANTRPFEGLCLALVVAVALLSWLLGPQRPSPRHLGQNLLLPMGGALALMGAADCYYNFRVTGHPLLLPYVYFQRVLDVTPRFLWQHPAPPPIYQTASLRWHYAVWGVDYFLRQRAHPWLHLATQLRTLDEVFLWPLLTLPLMFAAFLPRPRRWWRGKALLSLVIVICSCAFVVEVFSWGHYVAPATVAFYGCAALGLRQLRRSGRRGCFLVRATLLLSLAYLIASPMGALLPTRLGAPVAEPARRAEQRAAIAAQLRRLPGQQLVVVSDPLDHFNTWIYNAAAIDSAKIVWARDLGAGQNAVLIAYFAQRRVWRLDAALPHPQLTAYDPATAATAIGADSAPEGQRRRLHAIKGRSTP